MHCIVPNITLALYQNQEINGLGGERKEQKERRIKDHRQQQNHPGHPRPPNSRFQKGQRFTDIN